MIIIGYIIFLGLLLIGFLKKQREKEYKRKQIAYLVKKLKKKLFDIPEIKGAKIKKTSVETTPFNPRVEHFVKSKMLERYLEQEYNLWKKKGGTDYAEWREQIPKFKKAGSAGEDKKGAIKNKKIVDSIRDREYRAEQYKTERQKKKVGEFIKKVEKG